MKTLWNSVLSIFLFTFFSLSHVRALLVPLELSPLRRVGVNDHFGSLAAETIDNKDDIYYAVSINLNGVTVPVLLDTGSTDLWVRVPGFPRFNDTEIPVQLLYGNGTYGVSGTIGLAPWKLGSYSVAQQAFLNITRLISRITLFDYDILGILGLGFPTASHIDFAVRTKYGNSSTLGRSVLSNFFTENPALPKVVTLRLTRFDDPQDIKTGGVFSIGEYDKNYTAVTTAPKIPQYPPGGRRWTASLEGIYVDQTTIPVVSNITAVPAGHAVALLDSGNPTASLPIVLWDAIYSRIPGAVKYPEKSVWILPCNTTSIVEMVFSGVKYAIHPLDLSFISGPITIPGGRVIACLSTFRGDNSLGSIGFDLVLGTAFLRNTYAAFNFGDSSLDGNPYIQLLSTIDTAKAISQVPIIRQKQLTAPPELPPAELVKRLRDAASSMASPPMTTSS